MNKRKPKQGLILLVVLGMLALFTLLAVSYVVASGASRRSSEYMKVKARNESITFGGSADKVIRQIIRGTNDQKSALYKQSLLDDVYGPSAIKTKFGHQLLGTNAVLPTWCGLLESGLTGQESLLAKLSLDPRDPGNPSVLVLSDFENAYNSRVLTILEGPLAGVSLRIYKYVGYVRGTNDTSSALYSLYGRVDPNLPSPMNQGYADSNASDLDFSVMVDLAEVPDGKLTGQVHVSSSNSPATVSLTLKEWIVGYGLSSLFYYFDGSMYHGYQLTINDAAFNNPGIGLEDAFDTTNLASNGFGNIDSRGVLRIPTSRPKISPAMLPNYDYLNNASVMGTESSTGIVGVSGIGSKEARLRTTQNFLRGASNEGYDVADYRDFWLAHQSFSPTGAPYIIPSFHKPELVYYIANLFGDPSTMTAVDVKEMLQLIDMSSARIMSVAMNGTNPNFRFDDPAYPRLPASFTWSSPSPTSSEVAILQEFVAKHIAVGGWDVDNDGDGVADSVWMDPNLPTLYSPEGKILKPLAAVLIEDMDGRVNVNLHGDRVQGIGHMAVAGDSGFLRNGSLVPQGFGYGPADISLNTVLNSPLLLQSSLSNFSIFDDRYGARRYHKSPVDFSDVDLDRVPGRRAYGTFNGNDTVGLIQERETKYLARNGILPAASIGRRTSTAGAIDRFGNLSYVRTAGVDYNPYDYSGNNFADENIDDPYEVDGMRSGGSDDPFALDELEPVLRRFDTDVAALPRRLTERLGQLTGYTSSAEVNRVLTTRQAELRHPNLAAASTIASGTSVSVQSDAGNFLGLIRMLHSQRYRKRSFPAQASDDPELSNWEMSALFHSDFAKGLRLDVNRPFGNGVDDDGDGQVDEPQELKAALAYTYGTENEFFPNVTTAIPGNYRNEMNVMMAAASSRTPLGSRQLLARQLYCLAQLIIPKDYRFASMTDTTKVPTDSYKYHRLRAAAIAQWAVNVVDFRDADAAMTRFEYDIFPFGRGVLPSDAPNAGTKPTAPTPPAIKTAFWAPDARVDASNPISVNYVSVNGVPVTDYIGVVWGMEFPELLLTESLATHDKRIRDTDLDGSGKDTKAASNPDDDYDQYRFPEGSLWFELFCPRTTATVNDNSIAGVPSSLYTSVSGTVALDVERTAPADAAGIWGVQPVWRIALSDNFGTSTAANPNVLLQNKDASLATISHQATDKSSLQLNGDSTKVPEPENLIGSGLYYDSLTPTATTKSFDRFVWFTTLAPDDPSVKKIPDLIAAKQNVRDDATRSIYYNRRSSPTSTVLTGGSYMVVGPRHETSFGSLTQNPFDGTPWTPILARADMSTPAKRPIKSPSHQGITLNDTSVSTTLLNGDDVLKPAGWTAAVKGAVGMICATKPPAEAAPSWATCFPNGVGLNVSMPDPIAGKGYWTNVNKPLVRLNSEDTSGANRPDGTYGYANTQIPPDSWIDVADLQSNVLPNHPFDYDATINPIIANGMAQTGTYPNVRAAYLQRLADPEMAYDPVNNPYITIDWISVDLTVFNGEAAPTTGATSPPQPLEEVSPSNPIAFQSRYKDGDSGVNIASGKGTVDTSGKNPTPLANTDVQKTGYSYFSPSTAQLRKTLVQPTIYQPNPAVTPQRRPSYFMHQLGYASRQPGLSSHSSASSFGFANVGYFRVVNTDPISVTANVKDYDGFGPPQTNANPLFNGAPKNLSSIAWLNRPFATPYELMLVPATSPGQFGYFHSVFEQQSTTDFRHPFQHIPTFQANNAVRTNDTAANVGYWGVNTTSTELDFNLLLEFIETDPPFADANKYLRPDSMINAGASSVVANRFINSYVPSFTWKKPDNSTQTEADSVRGSTYVAPYNKLPSYVATGKINFNTIAMQSTGRMEALQAIENNFLGGADDKLFTAFYNSRRGYSSSATSNFFTSGDPINTLNPNLNPNFPSQFVGAFKPALSASLTPPNMRNASGVESTALRAVNPAAGSVSPTSQPLFSPDTTVGNNTQADVDHNAFSRLQRITRLPNLVTNQSNVFAVWVTTSLYEYDPLTGFGREYVDETGKPKRERKFFIIDRTVPVGFRTGEDLNTDNVILLKRKLQ